eukprot:TRINITY_DN36442_c0_g1_i1.p1 TRINITY_DN36442_c0_g1~~TRINITY_DN36442_c0_g1_i1.p1  ORF type:complete len:251 (+),score=16.42 TRINITY_DN36442_c0_g1_i1:274-1026(+)
MRAWWDREFQIPLSTSLFAGVHFSPDVMPGVSSSEQPQESRQEPAVNDFRSQPLFGGAILADIPTRFQDVSDFREVPDNQEVFADGARDESVVVELLERKADVADADAATWFLSDLMREQEAEAGSSVVFSAPIPPSECPHVDASTFKSYAVGKMVVSKGRQGSEASNVVRVYLGNLRLTSVETDLLITVNEPLFISEQSESASAAGVSGFTQAAATEAAQGGIGTTAQVFQRLLESFQIVDWDLFGHSG